jgi:hypothetical protein
MVETRIEQTTNILRKKTQRAIPIPLNRSGSVAKHEALLANPNQQSKQVGCSTPPCDDSSRFTPQLIE